MRLFFCIFNANLSKSLPCYAAQPKDDKTQDKNRLKMIRQVLLLSLNTLVRRNDRVSSCINLWVHLKIKYVYGITHSLSGGRKRGAISRYRLYLPLSKILKKRIKIKYWFENCKLFLKNKTMEIILKSVFSFCK